MGADLPEYPTTKQGRGPNFKSAPSSSSASKSLSSKHSGSHSLSCHSSNSTSTRSAGSSIVGFSTASLPRNASRRRSSAVANASSVSSDTSLTNASSVSSDTSLTNDSTVARGSVGGSPRRERNQGVGRAGQSPARNDGLPAGSGRGGGVCPPAGSGRGGGWQLGAETTEAWMLQQLQRWDKADFSARLRLVRAFVRATEGRTFFDVASLYGTGTSLFFTRLLGQLRLVVYLGLDHAPVGQDTGEDAVAVLLRAITLFLSSQSSGTYARDFISGDALSATLAVLDGGLCFSDDDRATALALLTRLLSGGRPYKELVCETAGIRTLIGALLNSCPQDPPSKPAIPTPLPQPSPIQSHLQSLVVTLCQGNPAYALGIYSSLAEAAVAPTLGPRAQRLAAQTLRMSAQWWAEDGAAEREIAPAGEKEDRTGRGSQGDSNAERQGGGIGEGLTSRPSHGHEVNGGRKGSRELRKNEPRGPDGNDQRGNCQDQEKIHAGGSLEGSNCDGERRQPDGSACRTEGPQARAGDYPRAEANDVRAEASDVRARASADENGCGATREGDVLVLWMASAGAGLLGSPDPSAVFEGTQLLVTTFELSAFGGQEAVLDALEACMWKRWVAVVPPGAEGLTRIPSEHGMPGAGWRRIPSVAVVPSGADRWTRSLSGHCMDERPIASEGLGGRESGSGGSDAYPSGTAGLGGRGCERIHAGADGGVPEGVRGHVAGEVGRGIGEQDRAARVCGRFDGSGGGDRGLERGTEKSRGPGMLEEGCCIHRCKSEEEKAGASFPVRCHHAEGGDDEGSEGVLCLSGSSSWRGSDSEAKCFGNTLDGEPKGLRIVSESQLKGLRIRPGNEPGVPTSHRQLRESETTSQRGPETTSGGGLFWGQGSKAVLGSEVKVLGICSGGEGAVLALQGSGRSDMVHCTGVRAGEECAALAAGAECATLNTEGVCAALTAGEACVARELGQEAELKLNPERVSGSTGLIDTGVCQQTDWPVGPTPPASLQADRAARTAGGEDADRTAQQPGAEEPSGGHDGTSRRRQENAGAVLAALLSRSAVPDLTACLMVDHTGLLPSLLHAAGGLREGRGRGALPEEGSFASGESCGSTTCARGCAGGDCGRVGAVVGCSGAAMVGSGAVVGSNSAKEVLLELCGRVRLAKEASRRLASPSLVAELRL